jgi:hypothetical protein
MVESRGVHLVAKKNVMVYLKGTIDYGLKYASNHQIRLQGFIDLDWTSSVADRKSTSGCFFSLGLAMSSWFSRKHMSVALSKIELDYTKTCSNRSEEMWLRKVLAGLFDLELEATCIWCENQSCVNLTENLVFHDKSKNIDIRYHYIKDMVHKGYLKLQYVTICGQIADVLTKPLSRVKFVYFRDRLGVVQKDITSKREL